MIIQVNQELCSGCGICVEACTVDAIRLIDHKAVITPELCQGCKACLYTCPNGAITALLEPDSLSTAIILPEPAPLAVSPPAHRELSPAQTPARGLVPSAGTALAFIGNEVVPRAIDLLFAALERRMARSEKPSASAVSPSSRPSARGSQGIRRQTRYRGGSTTVGKSRKGGEDHARR